jgi:hypothetical protein
LAHGTHYSAKRHEDWLLFTNFKSDGARNAPTWRINIKKKQKTKTKKKTPFLHCTYKSKCPWILTHSSKGQWLSSQNFKQCNKPEFLWQFSQHSSNVSSSNMFWTIAQPRPERIANAALSCLNHPPGRWLHACESSLNEATQSRPLTTLSAHPLQMHTATHQHALQPSRVW